MAYRLIPALLCAGLFVSSVAYGGGGDHKNHEKHTEHDEQHTQHETHVHGTAQLLIAIDDDVLAIELHSPAMNIVGFEHKPKTAAQKKAIQEAVAVLQQPANLFGLSAEANCVSHAVEVDAPYAAESHKEHKHDHDEETHSEFAAHYHFDCQDMAMLKTIEVNLIKQFSGIEGIEVQLIAPTGQRKFELTATKDHIDL